MPWTLLAIGTMTDELARGRLAKRRRLRFWTIVILLVVLAGIVALIVTEINRAPETLKTMPNNHAQPAAAFPAAVPAA